MILFIADGCVSVPPNHRKEGNDMNGSLDSEIVRKIKALYHDDERAQKLFDWLAGRTNDVAETSIDRIAHMIEVSRFDAIELAKLLSEIGVCEFIVGRKGWKSRVQWRYSVRSLGQAANGSSARIEKIDPELEEEAVDRPAAATDTVEVESSLPQGLSLAEAKQGLAITFGVKTEAIEIIIRG
jgi:hypothetical protein